MWEIVKRGLQRERSIAGGQFGRSRRESVQRMHSEIVEAFLKAGQQAKHRHTLSFSSTENANTEERRGMRGGLWRAVSNLGFAIAMAIRLLNPYVLITAAFGSQRSIFAHLSARVDSMRAVLSPRTGRRRRLTAWIQETLPQRHIPEAAAAVWEDGSLLCGIVDTAVSGACPGYDALSHPNTDRSATLWLGQKLVSRYLGVPPVFTDEELMSPFLTVSMERRLLRYLSAVRSAVTRIEVERQKRYGFPMEIADDRLASDCIVQSAIGQKESMLECVARGMGLILGVQGRSSTFYLYLNPNHPHRHVHRLMKNANLQLGNECVDDEAGAILMQIRGPDGDFGAALISTVPSSSSSSKSSSMGGLMADWRGRIPITYDTTEESVKVSFVPLSAGIHELSLLLRGGSHVPGSPFYVTVEKMLQAPIEEEFESGKISKASSYDSGLNRICERYGNMHSDSELTGSWHGSLRQRKRVISRIVDFVTEKMVLTEDGKLERLPKSRRSKEKKRREEEIGIEGGKNPTQPRKHYYTAMSPTRSRQRQGVPNSDGKTVSQTNISVMDTSPLLAEEHKPKCDSREEIPAEKVTTPKTQLETVRVSKMVEPSYTRRSPIDFHDHCRRILWLCDILLKHSPRKESLEILNTAGDILGGKRVHPTIIEESEPEECTSCPVATSLTAKRLQRARSDARGLNELAKWKDNRRSLHTWARPDRGGSVVGGRLLHKGGNYRGIVLRDLNAEAITGAYAGGDDSIDEGDEVDKEERMKEYLREGHPMSRKPHFSVKKRAAERTLEKSGGATENSELVTTPDAEKDPGVAEISGKDSNKHITTKNTETISYKKSKVMAKGVGTSGDDTTKGTPTLSEKAEVDQAIEGKTTNLEENKGFPRRHETERKVSVVDKEQLAGPSGQDTFDQQAKLVVVDSGMKSVKSEVGIKEPMKEEDSSASEEKTSALRVKEEGKINGRPSRENSLPPLAKSSARRQSPEPPEGTEAEKPSVAGGSTEFPGVCLPGEGEVGSVGAAERVVEWLMKGEKDGKIQEEKATEVEVKDMGEEKSERRASEGPNFFTEAKEREEEVKEGKKLGEGMKNTISSYTQMISRMLCTDSFPQQSLEWFESGEKVEGELEGSIETMEDMKMMGQESAKEDEPWGDVETGLGFGQEEDAVMRPDAVGNEDYLGRVTSDEEGILPDFSNPQLNQDEEENNDRPHRMFTETGKRSGVGVGVGVGVVVAGGLFSKDDNTSQERKGDEGSTWWKRRDSSKAERMIEMAKKESIEKNWEAISTGIDAMEDESIAKIITGVVGGIKETRDDAEKLRRWSASEEAVEDMGKKDEMGEYRSKYGEERIAGHSITKIPPEESRGAVGRLQSGRVSKEEASSAFERQGVVKGSDSVRGGGEQARKKKDSGMEPRGASIPEGEWWSLRDKVDAGVGGIGLAWGSKETEAGKLGRHIPEEKGIEVREWEEAKYRRENRKAGFGGESAPVERQHHKGIGGKEDLPSVSAGSTDDPLRTGERKGEKRGTTSRGASLKHEKIERAEEAGEALSGAENSKEKEKEKEGASRGKESVGQNLKRAERVEMEDLKIKRGTETDEKRKGKGKEPLSTGTEFSSESAESENKYSLAAIKESLREGGESSGRATKGDVGGGRKPNQVLVKSTKGVVLGSVTEGKCKTSFQGAMELGVEKVDNLLGRLIDIPKDNAMTEQGSSPKRVGEGIYGVKMSLEDWGKGMTEVSDYLGPETEVIVGEYEEMDEDIMESGAKSERCTVFKPSGEDANSKPTDGKNRINEEIGGPLLIVEESMGKRQYNFISDNLRGDVTSVNQSQSTTKDGADRQTRRKKDDNEREVSNESDDPFSRFESGGEQSQRNRNTATYPDLEELIGSDYTYKTTTCTAQFNLWPSEEAFGERKVMESVESMLSGKSPMREVVAGILGSATHFSRSTIVRSNSPQLMRVFEEGTGNTGGKEDESEEEIILIEQDFDDRSDELQQTATSKYSDMSDFDVLSHPRANSGDAFLIFESPGVTTFLPFEMEDIEERKEFSEDVFLEKDGGFDLGGGWQEVTLFLDEDDDENQDNSRIMPIEDEKIGDFLKDSASAVTTENESSPKHKTPVLPTGRWSARLSMSPAMSAISEEEAEEAIPEKEQRESSLDTGGEPARWDSYEEENIPATDVKDMNPVTEEKGFEEVSFQKVVEENRFEEVPEKKLENTKSTPHELSSLQIEVEDGFGETFTRRRSSTPSVVSDLGDTSTPVADCGAAFVVSSELAVTLALGVSITQIIPTVVDPAPPIPQAEEAADAIAMERTNSQEIPKNKKDEAMQKERGVLHAESKAAPSDEQQREWILIDTTNAEGIKEEKGKKEDGERVETVGAVEEAAALTIADGSTMERRRGYGGAIKKESIPRAGKSESKGRGEERSEFDFGTMDPIKGGMRGSRKSGKDNEASSRAKCDGNEAVKGKESFVRRKREQDASDGMNITGGDGNDFGKKYYEGAADRDTFNAFEGGLIRNSERRHSEDAVRKEKTMLKERKNDLRRSSEGDGKRSVTLKIGEETKEDSSKSNWEAKSTRKYSHRESTESGSDNPSDKGRTKGQSQNKDDLMVDKILELTFGEKASPNRRAERMGRRESVFDDYKFDWWEKGFEIKMPKKPVETQESTGLEYYLDDVDQLLNVELEATEPEVKYISAKEIMENFTKVIESPEKNTESSSGSEWSSPKGGNASSSDDLIDIASGTHGKKEDDSSKSRYEKNLWEDDLFDAVSKSRNRAPSPREENKKTIDDLLFSDEIPSLEQQPLACEENKPREEKEPLKDSQEIMREFAHFTESKVHAKHPERRNRPSENLNLQKLNLEEEHGLEKKLRESAKGEKSAERKSPQKLSDRSHKTLGIFKTFNKSDEDVNLLKESKEEKLGQRRSINEEEKGIPSPQAVSERSRMTEKEEIRSTSHDPYHSSFTEAARDIFDPGKMTEEKTTASNKENASSTTDKGEMISESAENTYATESSLCELSKVEDTKSGSDGIGRIKPEPKEKSVGKGDSEYQKKTEKWDTQSEVKAREMENMEKNESEGTEIGKGEKLVGKGSSKGRDKIDGRSEGEIEGKKDENKLYGSKLPSQSSSIDEYRKAVSEAYAFLDVHESTELRSDEERIRRGLRKESVSWNASVARMDSWDTEEWSVISGMEGRREPEGTRQDEIDSSESSLSSPLSENRKATDQTESAASSTKDTSTEESVDTKSKHKQRKSKDFNPNDEEVFQAKITVASRKEYWDKRVEEVKTQNEEIPTPTSKRKLSLSDKVKKGRMSFEQSSSATENSDSGKSSSDSPPHKEKRSGRQIPAVQRKRESNKATPTQPTDINREESDQSVSKASPESSSDSEMAKALLDESTAAMAKASEREPSQTEEDQKHTLMGKEPKDQEMQQKEEASLSSKPAAMKKVGTRRSKVIENAEKMLLKACTSDDEKSEKKVPSIRVRGIVSRSKIELEKQPNSPPEKGKKAKQTMEDQGSTKSGSKKQPTDSSSPSEEEGKSRTKAPSEQKTGSKNGESVSRLTKLFSFTSEEGPTPTSVTCSDGNKVTGTKLTQSANEVAEDAGLENMPSTSEDGFVQKVYKQVTAEVEDLKEGQEKRKFNVKSTRPTEIMSEDEGGFVARRKKYWDAMRGMSLDQQRRDSKDLDDQSAQKSDMRQVRSMWERRASLDTIQLIEERRRMSLGRKFISENLTSGRRRIPTVREASAERAPSPAKPMQENISNKEQQPKDKTVSDKEDSENKATVHKSIPPRTPTESQQEKSLAQSFAKGEKKYLPEQAKNDGKGRSGGDIPFHKAVSPEKSKSETRLSHDKNKPPAKETAECKSFEENSSGENKVSSDRRSPPEKKTIKGDITSGEKMRNTDRIPPAKGSEKMATAGERIKTTDRIPSEKTGEKVETSPKAPVREKQLKSKKTTSLEKKTAAEKKTVTDPNTGANTAKSSSPSTSSKEIKYEKKSASGSNKVQKSIPEKTSAQDTQSKFSSDTLKSSKVPSSQRRESLTPKDPWDSEEEKKAMEYALSRKRRSSVEIRVTDDEDVCVMREFTVVPVFPSKMETYEEEDEDGREMHSLPVSLDGDCADVKDESKESRRRKSLPPRNINVSSAVSNGKQRFESGKSTSKYSGNLSEEVAAKGTVTHQKKQRAVLPTLEEKLDVKTNPGVLPKGRKGQRPSAVPTGESKHRMVPASIDEEYQRAELGEEGPAEENPATSSRGEGGDDGRTAISRRAAKGTAPMQKKKPPPSAASSPDSEIDATELPRSFLSAPTAALRRHSTGVSEMRDQLPQLTKRRGSGDLGSPRKTEESKKRFTRARQFFENMEKGKDSPTGGEEESDTSKQSIKKKKVRGTTTDIETGKASVRKSSTKRRSPLRNLAVRDSSESTPDSDKQTADSERLQQRRRSRRGSFDMIHSAPGSDVDNSCEASQKAPPRRKKAGEPVLRSQMFGGSERQPRVSERFNVMDLFKDVAGAGTGGSGDLSGRTTPLGIPHQAAVLAALRSVEDVRSAEATSPYDLYRPVEAADDCEPSSVVSPEENANVEGPKEEESEVKFESSMSLHSKREYQAEYPHLPMTSPRRSRHRSSHVDLIPRNVLLKLDNTQSSTMTTPSRRSQAELF